jgi:TonB-linked SusC/RagA family outer membrane protein
MNYQLRDACALWTSSRQSEQNQTKQMYCFYTKKMGMPPGVLKKLLLVMKLTTFILITVIMQVSASSYAQKITLTERNTSLIKVFEKISEQSGYDFLFSTAILKDAKAVTINVRNEELKAVLEKLFENQPLEYKVNSKSVVISKKEPSFLENIIARFQNIDVRGRVVDSLGNGLPGASIKVKNGKGATTSNANGEFYLQNVDENAVLVITYIGYETREVTAVASLGSVVLKMSDSKLSEVQVIAYGKVEKKYLTSNIQDIKADAIASQPVTNPLLALQGRIPGLFIQQTSGNTGSGVNVLIQGANSMLNGNIPFYVIDGVPYSSNNLISLNGNLNNGEGAALNFINPADIESVSILKDADATAIYGSRAANGAILITTKKGKAGDTRVNVDMQTGWGQISRKLDLMNTSQYLDLRKEAIKNAGGTIGESDYDLNGTWDVNKSHDWQDILVGGTAKYTNLQASISGGTSNTRFYAGGGYNRQTTVLPGNLADSKGNVHFSLNHMSNNQKLKFDLSGSYQQDINNFSIDDFMSSAISLAPNAPDLYNADGSLNWGKIPGVENGYSFFNPLAALLSKYKGKNNNLISNSTVGYEIVSGLELKTSLGYTRYTADESTITPITAIRPDNINPDSRSANYSNRYINSWIIEPQLSYTKRVGLGNFDGLLGATFQEYDTYNRRYAASGYTSDGQLENIQAATSVQAFGAEQSTYKYSALFGRLNYRYQNKYIINFNLRRDGSSRFGSENLFHTFYSIGGAWLFADENFSKSLFPFLSKGKLRVTYGTTGNDQIGDYGFLNLYNSYFVGNTYQQMVSLVPRGHTNPYLQWEETHKLNLGLDIGVLKDRVTFNINYFRNRSSNQLLLDPLLIQTGFPSVRRNLPATVQNTGWEMMLDASPLKNTAVKWETSINLTIPKNKLVRFDGLANSAYVNSYVIGQPTSIIKVFDFMGVNSQTGLYEFRTAKGEITTAPVDPSDKTAIVDLNPKYYGGFYNSLSYKGFELSALLQFVKQTGPNYRFGASAPGLLNANQPITYLDRWKTSGDNSNLQKVNLDFSEFFPPYLSATNSSAAYSDASYVRLKTACLSYTIPSPWLHKAHIYSAKIFMQGQNLFTITNYDGTDPETKSNGSLPTLRMYMLGVSLTL